MLQKYNLPFDDRDIIGDSSNFQEMVQKSGQTLQPTLEIDGHIIADVSGEELERYLIRQGIVRPDGRPTGAPTNAPCSDAEHAAQGGWSDPIKIR